jgi:DNA-binding transcriptional ArsR family regulator
VKENPVETTHMSEEARRLAKMLANPKRLQALRLVIGSPGPISPKGIFEQMPPGGSLPNIAYHVRVLAQFEVIALTELTQVRGASQHFYVPNSTVVDAPVVQRALAETRAL